jgi:hypothetical protein
MPAVIPPVSRESDADRLGNEITELCGYIAAASHLLERIREFDACRYREQKGFGSCTQ